MQLYSVYFTNKHIVTKYNSNGKKIGSYIDDIPQALHALPYSTAMQYATCDNFRLERYYIEANQKQSKGRSGKPASRDTPDYGQDQANTDLKKAAIAGDLAAGLNAT